MGKDKPIPYPEKTGSISASLCYQTSEIKIISYKQGCYLRTLEYTICPLCPIFTFANSPPPK